VRLFVAVEIDATVAQRAAALGEALRRRAREAAPRARVTWVAADRLHVTVRFIGEVDERQATAIRAALAPRLELDAFDLVVAGAGAFPPKGPPRALFAGIAEGAEGLVAVEREVSARLVACGVPREDRAYRPHLTLARVREAAGLRSASLLEGAGAGTLGAMRADAITLFQSRLSPEGPTYEALQRTPLRGAAVEARS
jgi:2'-5' RNA ligase